MKISVRMQQVLLWGLSHNGRILKNAPGGVYVNGNIILRMRDMGLLQYAGAQRTGSDGALWDLTAEGQRQAELVAAGGTAVEPPPYLCKPRGASAHRKSQASA